MYSLRTVPDDYGTNIAPETLTMAQRHHRGSSKPGPVDESPPPPRRILGPTNCERRPQRFKTRQHTIRHRIVGEVGDNPRTGRRRMVCLDSIPGRCGTNALLEATCLPSPRLDVRPIPNHGGVEVGDRIRKVIMASPPIMNHLGPRDTGQSPSNLGRTYQLFNIDRTSHSPTLVRGGHSSDIERLFDPPPGASTMQPQIHERRSPPTEFAGNWISYRSRSCVREDIDP